MLLVILFSILATLGAAETSTPSWAPMEPWGAGVLVGLLVLLGAARAIMGVRYAAAFHAVAFDDLLGVARRYRRARWGDFVIGLVAAPALVYATGWPASIRSWCGEGLFLLDELAILGPTVFALLTAWAWQAVVDEAIFARRGQGGISRRELLMLQLRQTGGFVLAPTLFALFIAELYEHFESQLAQVVWLAPVALIAGLILAFPLVLCWIWPTSRMQQGPLRNRLEEASNRSGMRVRDILIWETKGTLVNAAIVGFAGSFRYLLLSDALIDCMSDEEIEAVVLHEAAHVRRRHLWLRLLLIGLPLASWAAVVVCVTGGSVLGTLAPGIGEPASWNALAGPALIAVYCAASLCWISRLMEHDADVWASERLPCPGDIGELPTRLAYVGMLERLAETGSVRRDHRTWLHPSLDERIQLLNAIADSAEPLQEFQARWRATVAVFIALSLVSPLAAWLAS